MSPSTTSGTVDSKTYSRLQDVIYAQQGISVHATINTDAFFTSAPF